MAAGIEFECPHCARVTRVPPELAGRQGRCPGCRKVLEIPTPSDEGRVAEPVASDRLSAPGAEASARAAQPPGAAEDATPREPLTALTVAALCSILLCPPAALLLGLVSVARAPGPRNRKLAWAATGLSVVGYLVHLAGHLLMARLRAEGS